MDVLDMERRRTTMMATFRPEGSILESKYISPFPMEISESIDEATIKHLCHIVPFLVCESRSFVCIRLRISQICKKKLFIHSRKNAYQFLYEPR